jgi:type III restriction enzyme
LRRLKIRGMDRWGDDDSKEKRLIGEVWEKRSGGRCLFIMPKGKAQSATPLCYLCLLRLVIEQR